MRPLDFPLLADENIAPDVVTGLRERGYHLRTAWEENLLGRPDVELLERAVSQGRVVITHDVTFARSAMRAGAPFIGVVCLRPGHISASFVLEIVDALQASTVDVTPPFVAVAERQLSTVRVRTRTMPPW